MIIIPIKWLYPIFRQTHRSSILIHHNHRPVKLLALKVGDDHRSPTGLNEIEGTTHLSHLTGERPKTCQDGFPTESY